MNELDIARHSRFVDPQLHVWGWEIPVYLFLGGMAAGRDDPHRAAHGRAGRALPRRALAALRRAGARLRWAWARCSSTSRTSSTSGASTSRSAGRARCPGAPGSCSSSIPVTILLRARDARRRGRRRGSPRGAGPLAGLVRRAPRLRAAARARRCRMAPSVAGVGLGVYTGILLSTLGARALWGSALLGPLFLVSGHLDRRGARSCCSG